MATLVCVLFMLYQRRSQKALVQWLRIVRWGIALGTVNISATICLLFALSEITAAHVFPVVACSAIIGSSVLSYYIWQERLIMRQLFGLAGAVVVIVLMNS